MLFNSYIFVLLFLPLCVSGYFILNHFQLYRIAQAFLLGMSLWFYGYFNPNYLLIMVSSILMNYLATWLMKNTNSRLWQKLILVIALLIDFGLLFYFKYYDFFIRNVNTLFHMDFAMLNVVLPLGISFFTFQQISYVVDAYRGEVPDYSFLQYATFVSFFPQLVAGPIVTHDELIPQFADQDKKKFQWDNFAKGMYIFVLGMAKKILIADVFGKAANIGFDDVYALDAVNTLVVSISYTIQIYFDFSGYCDMAIGLGNMMNLDLPVNFDSPYKALSVTEFWKRWHKTLTRFFRKYVYIPLGGNRNGRIRTYLNILIVFCLSGLWHGSSWSFIVWGAMHGVMQVGERMFRNRLEKLHPAFRWMGTFAFLNVSWIFFRADRLLNAVEMIRKMLLMQTGPIRKDIASVFYLPEVEYIAEKMLNVNLTSTNPELAMGIYFFLAFVLLLGCRNSYEKMKTLKLNSLNMFWISLLLVWCICSFAGVSTFLYFNF